MRYFVALMFDKTDKVFFGIALASIMILGAFSFTTNLLPEADAAWNRDGVYAHMKDVAPITDYYRYGYVTVSAGNYASVSVYCNSGDDVVASVTYYDDSRIDVRYDFIYGTGDMYAYVSVKNTSANSSTYYVYASCAIK